MSGDLDLLPPSAGGDPLGVRRRPRHCDDLGDASSRSEFDEACALPGGNTGRMAREVHRHGSLLVAVNPFTYATGSPREPAEERH
jgi:hypothetical protein